MKVLGITLGMILGAVLAVFVAMSVELMRFDDDSRYANESFRG